MANDFTRYKQLLSLAGNAGTVAEGRLAAERAEVWIAAHPALHPLYKVNVDTRVLVVRSGTAPQRTRASRALLLPERSRIRDDSSFHGYLHFQINKVVDLFIRIGDLVVQ